MITFLTYLIAFGAGFVTAEVTRRLQDHLSLIKAVRTFGRVGESNAWLRVWSANPTNRCGCADCRRWRNR